MTDDLSSATFPPEFFLGVYTISASISSGNSHYSYTEGQYDEYFIWINAPEFIATPTQIAASLGTNLSNIIFLNDIDSDGVIDDQEECPNTPKGNNVYDNGCVVIKGDINRDGNINLEDSILGLKVLTSYENSAGVSEEIDGDGKIGLKDTIYIIQRVEEKSGK